MPGHDTKPTQERSKRSRSILLQALIHLRGFPYGLADHDRVDHSRDRRASSPGPRARGPRHRRHTGGAGRPYRSGSTPSRRARRQSPSPRPRKTMPPPRPPRSRTPRPRRRSRASRACDAMRPYPVATVTVTLVDPTRSTPARGSTAASSSRTLTVTISYPVDRDARRSSRSSSSSTGTTSTRRPTDLEQEIAAAGFVVAAPDFPVSSSALAATAERDIVEQATDVSFVITCCSTHPASHRAQRPHRRHEGRRGRSLRRRGHGRRRRLQRRRPTPASAPW